jgi:hypothetical protein
MTAESGGWNVETLKELMESEFRATRDALAAVVLSQTLQNKAQEEAIKVASAANALALTEAKVGPQKQFDELRVKIEDLLSRSGGSVPRGEMDALFASAASNRHVEIADAIGTVVKQFSADLDRLTRAVETQGEQFNRAVTSQNNQWGVEFNTLNKNVADIQQKQLTRQAQGAGVALTGRTAAAALSVLVALIAVFSFLSRYLLK